ncbi:MAG: hypothetical protein ACQEQM_07245 [Thermoplasmatota archaeon]
MPEDEFKISDLREALLHERNSKQLADIRPVFYRLLRDYLNELEKEIEEVGFPSDSRSKALHREFNKAKNYAEDLFSRRAQKVALAAVHHVSGSKKVNTDSMTSREEKFYNDMIDLLEEMEEELFFGGYKREVESEKEKIDEKKEVSEPPKKELVEEPEDESIDKDEYIDKDESIDKEKKELDKNEVPEKIPEPSPKEFSSIDEIEEYTDEKPTEILIHVTEKIPPFVDMDATYDLKKEDVVTLREDIANVLIKRGKARKIVLD